MNDKPNYRSELLANALRITIPSPRKSSTILFSSFWVALCSIVGGFGLQLIVRREADLCLSVWAIMWLLFGIMGIYELLWQLAGKEEIEVTSDSISIRQLILGIGWPKVYGIEYVSRLRVDPAGRVEPNTITTDSEGYKSWNKGTGVIAFDYKERTIRMGIGVDEAGAKELVAEIQQQYPQYKK